MIRNVHFHHSTSFGTAEEQVRTKILAARCQYADRSEHSSAWAQQLMQQQGWVPTRLLRYTRTADPANLVQYECPGGCLVGLRRAWAVALFDLKGAIEKAIYCPQPNTKLQSTVSRTSL